MTKSRVWLDANRVMERNGAYPDQSFTSVEYPCTDREQEAILDFANKIRLFERWCREARQTIQTGGDIPKVPGWLITKPATPNRRKQGGKTSTKQKAEGSEG